MKKNIGPKNRFARIIAGLVLVAISVYSYDGTALPIAGIAIGAFMIAEGVMGFCAWHTIRGTKDMR